MPTRRENCVTALTFEEARERSRLLDVRGYRVDLDVTGGDEAFGSVTVVRFGCRAPGAGSFIELSPARLRRAVLNGREVDPATLTGNRLPPAGGKPMSCGSRRTCRIRGPARACTGSPTPPTARPTSPCTAGWTTLSGSSPPSISPT